jgi:yersiniabactin nonribosomal peptide synthetase
MTDVQQAYWIGRQHGFALGASSSQFFIEFKVRELDVVRFNQAMDKLIERHDMLRAVVQNHQQQVLINVPSFDLKCHLFDDLNNPEADAIRNELSHQVNNPEFWPLFSIEAILNQSQEARLFINLDNMMLDGLSMKIFLSELETFYHNPTLKLPELNVTFRDYVNWKNTHKDSDLSVIDQGKAYWHSQLATLPPAPNLPIQSDPAKLHKPKFIRAETRLMPEEWAALKEIATRHQVTPSAILMCAYASTLSAWSDNKAVTLNLTLFDRKAVHPQINHVMGDFTTLLLLAWHPENNWLTSLKRLQAQLAQDLQHRDVSAVWVMRELARQQNTANTSMPVVFTSALGTSDGDFLPDSGWLTPSWGISQTPQVWLDHQVYESSGYLCLNWDAVESLLPQPLLDKMFGHYIELLKMLARKPECWSLPLNQLISSEHNITRFTATPATSILENTKDQHVDPIKVRQIQETFDQIVCSSVGERENFFDAGANSLQLVQMHSALHQLGMSLSVTDLFTYPSPISLATALVGKAAPLDSNDTLKVRQQRQSNRKNNRRQRIK